MKRRVLVLPLAAIVILALCAWRIARPPRIQVVPRESPGYPAPAPLFDLEDERPEADPESAAGSESVPGAPRPRRRARLAPVLGRHRILVLFFDGRAGSEVDPVLMRLKERFPEIDRRGVKVFALSTASASELQRMIAEQGPFPFPVLRDPNGIISLKWKRAEFSDDGILKKSLTGLFLVDRAGNVLTSPRGPLPESDPLETIDKVAKGE